MDSLHLVIVVVVIVTARILHAFGLFICFSFVGSYEVVAVETWPLSLPVDSN